MLLEKMAWLGHRAGSCEVVQFTKGKGRSVYGEERWDLNSSLWLPRALAVAMFCGNQFLDEVSTEN